MGTFQKSFDILQKSPCKSLDHEAGSPGFRLKVGFPRGYGGFLGTRFIENAVNQNHLAVSEFGGRPVDGIGGGTGGAGPAVEASGTAASGEPGEHGLTADAPRLGSTGSSFVTGSMVVTWTVALGLIVLTRYATRKMQLIPDGAQNFWEWLVETLHDFLEGIIGPDLVKRTFWFFATVFIFILFTNWFGLIPGIGTIGWGAAARMGSRLAGRCFGAATPT